MLMTLYRGAFRFVLNVKTEPSFVMYCKKVEFKKVSKNKKSGLAMYTPRGFGYVLPEKMTTLPTIR